MPKLSALDAELNELWQTYTSLMDRATEKTNKTAAFDHFDAQLVLARYFDVVEERLVKCPIFDFEL